jgi:hypothetical protein
MHPHLYCLAKDMPVLALKNNTRKIDKHLIFDIDQSCLLKIWISYGVLAFHVFLITQQPGH